MGHAFNLFHTFDGDDFGGCGDDGIFDTPMHDRTFSYWACNSNIRMIVILILMSRCHLLIQVMEHIKITSIIT